MVSVCTVPARGGRSCEHFGGYKTINRIPLPLKKHLSGADAGFWRCTGFLSARNGLVPEGYISIVCFFKFSNS